MLRQYTGLYHMEVDHHRFRTEQSLVIYVAKTSVLLGLSI
jgi:hypothetical protein